MQREGLRAFDGSELYFETKHYCTGKVYNGLLGPGRLRGGRRPVGSRFRQPDRTPFFRLTPAFGLRSLRKNAYVLSGVDGTGPPTGDRPRRSVAAGRGWLASTGPPRGGEKIGGAGGSVD